MENLDPQNPEFQNSNFGTQPGMKGPLPNAGVVLALGIISIVGCCCYGLPGIVCGIIALIMAKKAEELYNSNPEAYTESSFSNVKTGRICAIVGLILSALYFIMMIIMMLIYGMAALSNPQQILDMYN